MPKPQKRCRPKEQPELAPDDADELSTAEQLYNSTPIINEIRQYAATLRNLLNPSQWRVMREAECLQSGNSQNVG